MSLNSSSSLKTPIFLALDVDDEAAAISIATKTLPYVGGFKVGPRLTNKYGSALVQKLSQLAPVFVDNKYYDIPNTVHAAVRTSFESGASFVTIHAGQGAATLKEIAKLEKELNAQRPFRILCVTVLTSFTAENLPKNWLNESPQKHVQILADEVMSSGLSGIVCSPEEVSLLHKTFPTAYLVTPGIRLATDKVDDQSRISGPREALAAGASALVIGRPIVNAPDIVAAANKFYSIVSL